MLDWQKHLQREGLLAVLVVILGFGFLDVCQESFIVTAVVSVLTEHKEGGINVSIPVNRFNMYRTD
jgi:hypothetical protein